MYKIVYQKMKIFTLKVYNKDLKNYLRLNMGSFLVQRKVIKRFGKTYEQMVVEGWLSASWINFFE